MAKGKGSKFERDTCRMLSLWWSGNARDDIFWRSAASGAMATMRRKKNKDTFGQCGDVAAVDPVGLPLLEFATIELKRGYSGVSFNDLLDMPTTCKTRKIDAMLQQVIADATRAKSYTWFLILQRDRRIPVIMIPSPAFFDVFPCRREYVRLRVSLQNGLAVDLRMLRLPDFLANVTPQIIRRFMQGNPPRRGLTLTGRT